MIICVDFDGTCVTHDYPKIGKDIGAIPILNKLLNNGHKIILYTMRCDNKIKQQYYLTEAVNWFINNNISLYGINENPNQKEWTSSPKVYGNLYIDDAALGCPLKFDNKISNRPFVDWKLVEIELIKNKIIN